MWLWWLHSSSTDCLFSPPQMVFGVGKVQMKFLHLLSTEASQNITLHCLSDPPYGTTDGFSSGPIHRENTRIRFRGWNKQMFEKDTLLEPHVLQDDCKVTSRVAEMSSLHFTALIVWMKRHFEVVMTVISHCWLHEKISYGRELFDSCTIQLSACLENWDALVFITSHMMSADKLSGMFLNRWENLLTGIHQSLFVFFSCTFHVSDPRWQLAPVSFLLPHSGQLSATYCRPTGVPHFTAQKSASHRNRSGLLPLTPASPS